MVVAVVALGVKLSNFVENVQALHRLVKYGYRSSKLILNMLVTQNLKIEKIPFCCSHSDEQLRTAA